MSIHSVINIMKGALRLRSEKPENSADETYHHVLDNLLKYSKCKFPDYKVRKLDCMIAQLTPTHGTFRSQTVINPEFSQFPLPWILRKYMFLYWMEANICGWKGAICSTLHCFNKQKSNPNLNCPVTANCSGCARACMWSTPVLSTITIKHVII